MASRLQISHAVTLMAVMLWTTHWSQVLAQYSTGVATWYTQNAERGSCGFGSNDLTDTVAVNGGLYQCGRCLEIVCDNTRTLYGRKDFCKNGVGSYVVRVNNKCPECGGNHIDMYRPAFNKIASGTVGMLNIKFKWVDCPCTNTAKVTVMNWEQWYRRYTVKNICGSGKVDEFWIKGKNDASFKRVNRDGTWSEGMAWVQNGKEVSKCPCDVMIKQGSRQIIGKGIIRGSGTGDYSAPGFNFFPAGSRGLLENSTFGNSPHDVPGNDGYHGEALEPVAVDSKQSITTNATHPSAT